MQVFKLQFHSALHVDSKGSGEPETAEEFVHSDTLSAAICLSWSAIQTNTGGELFLDPPFKVSSAFPYVGDILLFPMPVWDIWKNLDVSKRKWAKEIRWISRSLLDQALSGNPIEIDSVKKLPCGIAVTEREEKAIAATGQPRAWVLSERQRVSVDRLNQAGKGGLFFFALQFFSPLAGLYFIADMSDTHAKAFRAALEYLGDSGIGADRNTGIGHFRIRSEEPFEVDNSERRRGWFNLSLFNPGSGDDIHAICKVSAYGLTTRSGWLTGTTVGRPPVRSFTEGSFFSAQPKGRVVEMFDDETVERFRLPITHTAPRDFRPISLPCAVPRSLTEDKL